MSKHSMAEISRAWIVRARELSLKPKTAAYRNQQEAFLQGVLAALTQTDLATKEDANRIGFAVAVGRIDGAMHMDEAAALDKAARVPS